MALHDYAEIERALRHFVRDGDVFELRILYNSKRTDSGYFTHISHAATAVCGLHEPYLGVYYTLNPVLPDLAARSYNRFTTWAKNTTNDPDVTARRWLLVDIDSDRPSGISATDAQQEAAFKVAREVSGMLELEGFGTPYLNASGNGAHLLYPYDGVNDDFTRDEVQKFLQILNSRFAAHGCKVDTTVFNAARICRLVGTWARKGDNLPDRPHRKALQVGVPLIPQQVKLGQIVGFNSRYADSLPKNTRTATGAAKNTYPDDERLWRTLNDAAYSSLSDWVPKFFPDARKYKQGYRIASSDLGLSYEEDMTIHPLPLGIKYFGIADQGDGAEGKRTPIGLLAEFATLGSKELAARALADTLKVPANEFEKSPISLAPPVNSASLPAAGESSRPIFDFRKVPSMAQLQARTFTERRWLIKDLLPAGNIMLAARPKMRKTFLALQLGIAVCEGGTFLGHQVEKGEVLFLGLEDNEKRLRDRINLLNKFRTDPLDLSGFRYWCGGVDIAANGKLVVTDPLEHERTYNTFPRGEAGVEALKEYLKVYPNTRLIVIDTYAHFRESNNNRDVYQRDYDQMMPITRFAAQAEITVVVVHHEKKGLASGGTGDFLEDVSGTSGITGAVDGVMSIKGKRGGSAQDGVDQKILLVSGRDIPRDWELDMKFDAERGGWLTAARQDVQEHLKALLARYPIMSMSEIQAMLPDVSRSRISQVLTQMKYDGTILHTNKGYSLPNVPYIGV